MIPGMALRARRAALVLGVFVLAFALSVVFAEPAEVAESAASSTVPPASGTEAGGEGRPVTDGRQPSPESLAALKRRFPRSFGLFREMVSEAPE